VADLRLSGVLFLARRAQTTTESHVLVPAPESRRVDPASEPAARYTDISPGDDPL